MKTQHQYIVTGTPTAGKSTFSQELVKKFSVQHLDTDPIIEGFEYVYPEHGITHKAQSHEKHLTVCKNFAPFISRVIEGYGNESFVIEGFRMPLEVLHEKFPDFQYFVFGYPSATPEERVAICRKYDVDNWTNGLDDAGLMKEFQFLIEESKYMQKVCERLGIPFFDTSKDYLEVIQEAVAQAK